MDRELVSALHLPLITTSERDMESLSDSNLLTKERSGFKEMD